jgi:hypothetical protein
MELLSLFPFWLESKTNRGTTGKEVQQVKKKKQKYLQSLLRVRDNSRSIIYLVSLKRDDVFPRHPRAQLKVGLL